MTIISLPTSSDLSVSSFRWACEILNETPLRLCVSPGDMEDARSRISDVDICVDDALPCCAWRLEGATRAVTSEGA